MERQIVWVGPQATSFVAVCDTCLAEGDSAREGLGYRAAKVQGTLHAEADVGFTRCRRGHRLCVRRAARAAVTAGR